MKMSATFTMCIAAVAVAAGDCRAEAEYDFRKRLEVVHRADRRDMAAKREPARQRFWFDVAELPQDVDYAVEVRAFNCFGKASRPLISGVWHSVPELDNTKK